MDDIALSAIIEQTDKANRSQPEYREDENTLLKKKAEGLEASFLGWFPLLRKYVYCYL